MGSFGDKLKRERQMRGVTLDEISESTKIARRHLEALEKEDFASLPGGVFNKGFVRAYARFIGIDEDQSVADYAAVANEAPPPEDQFPLEIHDKPNRELNPRNSELPLIGSVVLLVLVVAGYVALRANRHPSAAVLPVASAASQPEDSGSRAESPEQPATRSSRPVSANAAPPLAGAERRVAANGSLPAKQVPAIAANVKKAPDALSNPAIPQHSFFVVIKAKEDAWISVVADGHRVSHGILKADKQRFIRAGKQILLTTGNAGGIDVSFNGKPLGSIGDEREARTLLFTPTGAAQQ
jgi:cytoskeleton protein RodZ